MATTWIQFLDKHADGVGFLAMIAIAGLVVCCVVVALAVAEFAGKRK